MTDSGRVLVLGSGFAGLWAALGAARRLEELDVTGTVDVTLISKLPFHDIRVRNYEADLSACRIPLSDLLDPVDVGHITAEVTAIDTAARTVTVADSGGQGATQEYDRLVIALGSRVAKPDIPGLREFGFDVDTYDGALKLQRHLAALSDGGADVSAATVVVVGAGLTGIETASELPGMLTTMCAGRNLDPRVVLIDHNPYVGSDMGASARPVIEAALSENGVETMTGVGVAAVDERGVTLSSGEVLAAGTVVWCAGMRANPLTAQLPGDRDRLGRLPVDDYLRVLGSPGVFAAGDVAAAWVDDDHLSVMSCQHGRPMGRYAGYNVIGDLLGEPMMPLRIPWYATVLDLGPAGAVYTEGWDRQVVAYGAQAKATKVTINTQRIYPPLNRDRNALLAAAAPVLQARPDPGQ
ncbi:MULTISPECIES: NAD(P)/FAD-dependent oxidoreductase [Rhodococcus]|uniref:NAD(P)/FAD-dependent oxidoreductase n=1 Tax=Rhodococcus oxybenzonivorans TaxID=1990687 RepID=A0AAE5A865_9NOCA|nr:MULTISPECIES: NAD(P)/FAD-dependent oxidoreductase [Rhodococcus]MDV7242373.1 NAD(P)/FAD-dependent oxidoreductase [Rhodococcus oxybenzonivorans]MDV7267680.1 NAD(P)/FAD-dependent oxidoreductase [Rhodococcus oxybenzonivorans]MDV7277120.1 NAD(P)/FAD-dependent oxidoreductase [Rhodococcus oxybenzonivorans]MDV7331862.1 NAD(P)/FAD-dependent oxidoreductase [Rhodococcus oxybenzonivorans]MDV7344083.1 NAD(P)/FAD-dependent oxidoreductase [Rhodococcus oxybenzonivorans]